MLINAFRERTCTADKEEDEAVQFAGHLSSIILSQPCAFIRMEHKFGLTKTVHLFSLYMKLA